MPKLKYLKPTVTASFLLASIAANAVPIAGYEKQAAIYGIALAPTYYGAAPLGVSLTGAQANASSVDIPLPSVSVDASVPASWPNSTFYFAGHAPEARSALAYYFTISGPSHIKVPINIVGTAAVGETNTAWASTTLVVSDSVDSLHYFLKEVHCVGAGLPLGSFLPASGTLAQNIATNQCGGTAYATTISFSAFTDPAADTSSGSITLEATVRTFQDSLHIYTASAASAYLDPILSIDPVFAAAHPGFSILFSPGIGNGPIVAVPEPSAALLVLAGLPLTVWWARRRVRAEA